MGQRKICFIAYNREPNLISCPPRNRNIRIRFLVSKFYFALIVTCDRYRKNTLEEL